MKKYMIVNRDGRFLSPMGFIATYQNAYQYDTDRDAKQYLQDNPVLVEKHGAKCEAVETSEAVGRFAGSGVQTAYSPWAKTK